MSTASPNKGEPTPACIARRLARDGFVLLERPCSDDFVEHILKVSRRRIHKVREALGSREIGIGSAAGYAEIVQRSPGRWDIPISPQQFGFDEADVPLGSLCSFLLGGDAEHSFSGIVYSDPGSPAQHWHIDSPHIAKEHRPAHALNVIVALHDLTMDMGPTECARGSHVLSNHLRNRTLVRDELVYQHADTSPEQLVRNVGVPVPKRCASEQSAGTCLVFDDRLLHRGLANRSDRTRLMAYFSYRRKGYRENTHFESSRSLFNDR